MGVGEVSTRAVTLVTGASSGIGAAFARACAARGDDLVLVARDERRLEELAGSLEKEHSIEVEVLAADLTTPTGTGVVEARLESDDPPVDLLVNNAGFGTVGKFAELPREREAQEIQLNVMALMRLCHAALPGMVGRERGGVINVSSVAGYQPTPLNATYGATKAFVTSFSHALHEELRGSGVNVMVLSPGFTRTEFQERAGLDSSAVPNFMWQSAEVVVAAALRAHDNGRAVCIPGALNQAGAAFSSAMPGAISRKLAGAIIGRVE
jgi:short-subunit dehydrogenase